MTLAYRVILIVAVLFAEKFLLNFFVDFDAAQAAHGFGAVVRITQHWAFRYLVTFIAAVALLCYLRGAPRLAGYSSAARAIPVRYGWLLLHAALIVALMPLSYFLYGRGATAVPFAGLVTLWLLVALAAVLALLTAMCSWNLWRACADAIGDIWVYAAIVASIGAGAMYWSQTLWEPMARMTFHLVQYLLAPVLPLRADPDTFTLSTDRFAVQISDICSGLEGLGLMSAFCLVWLAFFRREYVFPQALALLPAGLLVVFLLNAVRIAALMVIGHAGAAQVAEYGFHSQAGWIAFNCAAAGLVFLSRKSPWISRAASPNHRAPADNPTAVFLMPFLALLAAAMLSRAGSGQFESLYGLRLVAGALALAVFWPSLRFLDWGFTWRGVLVGVAAFGVWIWMAPASPVQSMPSELSQLPLLGQGLWLAARIATAVLVVPIAEELAYRGYLMRRLMSSDFESVPYGRVAPAALLASALAFGVAHGSMWLPATLAGVLYGGLLKRSGRLGEAVAAHATTNALIAGCVLLRGQWQLW